LNEARKVEKPNKYTKELLKELPRIFEHRKSLTEKDCLFLENKLIPYLKSCQTTFFGKDLEIIEPLLEKEVKKK